MELIAVNAKPVTVLVLKMIRLRRKKIAPLPSRH